MEYGKRRLNYGNFSLCVCFFLNCLIKELADMKKIAFFVLVAALAMPIFTSCEKQDKPITDGVSETLDYGVTLGKTLNKAKQQIPQMNAQHNKELDDALKGM